MNSLPQVPPGFRFHPTDEELVDYYLRRKIASRRIDLDVIKDVDLYKIEPWDLQELCRIGREEQNEWYFFSHKDKKYPTGTRTNRATSAGFWKATGRDKPIYSKQTELIGMRKTLVFYKGRAPNGQKSDWIMHEYRLETDENATSQEEGWVVCRVFKKRIASMRKLNDYDDSTIWYEDHFPLMDYSCKKEMVDSQYSPFLQLPNLESPKMVPHLQASSPFPSYGPGLADFHQPLDQLIFNDIHDHTGQQSSRGDDQVTDWRVLDKFVASQLSHEETVGPENASVSSLSCHVDLWK